MRFFKIGFHRSPPQFLLETKGFASIKDYSRFSATYRRPSSKNFFSKKFLNFLFFEKFSQVFAKHGFASVFMLTFLENFRERINMKRGKYFTDFA